MIFDQFSLSTAMKRKNATKKDLILATAEKTNCSQQLVKQILEQGMEQMILSLVESGRLELRNFGIWEVRVRRSRLALNPRTGEKIQTKEKPVITFRAGKKMEQLRAEQFPDGSGLPSE